jgi:UDP-2,3-diacylglucosamine pyrophosphatase LpxH
MKKLFLHLVCASLLLIWGCSSSANPQPLTVKTSISTSDSAQTPAAVDPVNTIALDFSEPLNMGTVEGKVSLYTVKAGGLLVSSDPPVEIVSNTEKPSQLVIKTKNGATLASGEGYKLVVSRGIQSVNGNTLAADFVRYFATDYNFGHRTDSIPELGNNRVIIVVISDIHLGDARSIDEKYGWFNKNTSNLINFLNILREKPNVRELVIAGDMFDQWVAPMTSDTFNGTSRSGFVDMIVAANKPIIDAINNIIKDGKIRVTYVSGNHDMLVESKDIQRVFPGISEAGDVQGLGAYAPLDRPEIIIEHGHRYDFFNAPDPISNRSITKTDSIMPPGFFVSKIATTSDMERGKSTFLRQELSEALGTRADNYYLSYWAAWNLIMSQKPVKASWNDKLIKTGIDGYTESYAINDLIPYHSENNGPLDVNLYKGIQDTWYARQENNKVPVPILPEIAIAAGAFNPALDAQSIIQYFENRSSNKRIVVFGHTHKADIFTILNHQLRGAIYANSGTWVDNGNPSCTFVAIIPQKDNGATTDTVTVYQYVDEKNIKKIGSAAIVN